MCIGEKICGNLDYIESRGEWGRATAAEPKNVAIVGGTKRVLIAHEILFTKLQRNVQLHSYSCLIFIKSRADSALLRVDSNDTLQGTPSSKHNDSLNEYDKHTEDWNFKAAKK